MEKLENLDLTNASHIKNDTSKSWIDRVRSPYGAPPSAALTTRSFAQQRGGSLGLRRSKKIFDAHCKGEDNDTKS